MLIAFRGCNIFPESYSLQPDKGSYSLIELCSPQREENPGIDYLTSSSSLT